MEDTADAYDALNSTTNTFHSTIINSFDPADDVFHSAGGAFVNDVEVVDSTSDVDVGAVA